MPALKVIGSFKRLFRYFSKKGWSKEDFHERYSSSTTDSWGYEGSPLHQARVKFILEELPKREFHRALEVGCAEGYITYQLATHSQQLVACDLSSEAVERASQRCSDIPNVEFHTLDVRHEIPNGLFDLCVFSDVLYYMTHPEIVTTLKKVSEQMSPGAILLFANEWCENYHGLTSPAAILKLIRSQPAWRQISCTAKRTGDSSTLTIGVFEHRR